MYRFLHGSLLVLLSVSPGSWALEHADATDRQIEAGEMPLLRDRLVSLADDHLRASGLSVDAARAWMSLSAPMPTAESFEIQPLWPEDGQPVSLPLVFEIRPATAQIGQAPIRATLAVSLMQDAWVSTRRLRRGSIVTCADLGRQRVRWREHSDFLSAATCDIATGTVALRELAAGDPLRNADVGSAPDVAAGGLVQLGVSVNGISLTVSGVALSNARVGDQVDVRLQRPARVLSARVTGVGSAELLDGAP